MKRCASCGRDIPESATVCEPCRAWAAEYTAASTLDASPAPAPAASGDATPAASRLPHRVSRPILGLAAAAVVSALVAAVLLSGRGGPSSDVAAAARPAPAPRAPETRRPPASTAAATQTWSSDHRLYWTGDQRGGAAFELPAENDVAIWMGRVRPLLVVRCLSKRTEVFVFTGSALKIEPETEDHTVGVTFDAQPEAIERWPDSAEHDALFAPDGASFAQQVMRARVLRVAYTPHNAAPVSAEFRVGGLGDLYNPAARACGGRK